MNVFNDISVNNNRYIQNKTQKQEQSDNLYKKSFIDKNKTQLSIAAGIGITALVIGGILYKKSLDIPAFKQLAEKIEFKQGETLEDAINFGQNVLGIKNYKGFEEADLDVVNWINEGLVHVNNASKGKIAMPKKIVYESFGIEQEGMTGGWMNALGTMKISKEFIKDRKETVKTLLEMQNNGTNRINELNKQKNFTTWMNDFINLVKQYFELSNKVFSQAYTSPFSVINHEMGHLQHCVNTKSNLVDLDEKSMELFKNSKDIASSISKYAETSPTEFVAECFSKMVDGHKLDDKTLELYKQLGGYII